MNATQESKVIKNKIGLLRLAQQFKKTGLIQRLKLRWWILPLSNPPTVSTVVSNELRKRAVFISDGGVRSVWLRHDLECFSKRLKALSAKVAQDGLILTEDQLRAVEKAREEKQNTLAGYESLVRFPSSSVCQASV